MSGITHGFAHELPDVEAFVALINGLGTHPLRSARALFAPDRPIIVARAPGRLDVMGGIADYCGSLVLEMPIREATLAAVQLDPSPRLRIVSLGADETYRTAEFDMPLADLAPGGEPVSYEAARAEFGRDPRNHWAAYIAGCFLVLMRERGMHFEQGARILIDSAIPEGKSVSSSAALEVAVMQAVLRAYALDARVGAAPPLNKSQTRCGEGGQGGVWRENTSPETYPSALPAKSSAVHPRDLALLCQKVENLVVGAPCGVMDQMTAVSGRADQLLALRCQPAELLDPVPIPDDIAFWGLDSGVRHRVGGSDYTSVRVGAFMGYRIIAEMAGLRVLATPDGGSLWIDDPQWRGYLANITPSEFESRFAGHLPESMIGSEFIKLYGGTTDPVTRIDPDRVYSIRTPTGHPIYENHRVQLFAKCLREGSGRGRLETLGRLMYESHASYSACGLGSTATDRIVELAKRAGPARGLYGAKITGGGSGGTVAILGHRDVLEAGLGTIAKAYMLETGHEPYLFTGSSPGAAEFGTIKLEFQI